MGKTENPATVVVMAKTPEAGKVKTRLAKSWGNEAALSAYILLVRKTLASVECSGLPRQLHIAGSVSHPLWRAAAERGWPLLTQSGSNLGQRMLTACRNQPSILVGCDFPGLTAELLQRANRKLQQYDTVAVPATDGGYVLLGLNEPHAELFSGHAWGSDSVWQTTSQAIASLGLSCYRYPAEYDLDTAADWQQAVADKLLPELPLAT